MRFEYFIKGGGKRHAEGLSISEAINGKLQNEFTVLVSQKETGHIIGYF